MKCAKHVIAPLWRKERSNLGGSPENSCPTFRLHSEHMLAVFKLQQICLPTSIIPRGGRFHRGEATFYSYAVGGHCRASRPREPLSTFSFPPPSQIVKIRLPAVLPLPRSVFPASEWHMSVLWLISTSEFIRIAA